MGNTGPFLAYLCLGELPDVLDGAPAQRVGQNYYLVTKIVSKDPAENLVILLVIWLIVAPAQRVGQDYYPVYLLDLC